MRICSIAWHISTHSSGERQNYSDPLYELALSRPCILRRLRRGLQNRIDLEQISHHLAI